ncbi:MAG: hypothetical protein MR821_01800 [Clostridiales bacterium]|nr:hypothetical protein [Clostridiales bacterium]
MILPLTRFTLTADALPDRLLPRAGGARFALPGAKELAAFGDLIGDEPSARPGLPPPCAPREADARESAPFAVPALLPEDVGAGAALHCALPLERMGGTHARLDFGLLAGRGEVLLDGERVARFENSPLTLELTDALHSRRRQTLTLRFDDARPAGVCGTPVLRVGQTARLVRVNVLPDARARTLTLRALVRAETAGEILLRVLPCPAQAAEAADEPPAARETALDMRAGETREVFVTLDMPDEPFVPGRLYPASSLRVTLLRRLPPLPRGEKHRFTLLRRPPEPPQPRRTCVRCDELVLMTGCPGDAPRFYVPLTRSDVFSPPDALAARLRELGVTAAALPEAGPDLLYQALTRAGIAALHTGSLPQGERERIARFACVCPAPVPAWEEHSAAALGAWRLCAMPGMRRSPRIGASPDELLEEAAGFPVDADAPGTQDVLQWLSAVELRLCAEAARQGRLTGPLCGADALKGPDAQEALRTALAPVHVSVLPLRGAWWTRSHFSATVCAFLPEQLPDAPLRALAVLEDEAGTPLVRLELPCSGEGGRQGLLEAELPDAPCVLTLSTRLLAGDAVLEQSALPVYVGERGPLEAAFRRS